MISFFKKHFIPHTGNEHRPHILRDSNIRMIVVVVILLEIITFLIPVLTHLNRTGGMAAVLPAVLDDLTNEERESQNLKTLAVSPILNKAAEMKATDMATKGYFAHTSPEGKTPWYWIEKVGYNYQYAGENLAINFSDSKDVTSAWMESPTHRANIVKGNYTEVGTGVAVGNYQGRETIFVAQVYANPAPVSEIPLKEIKPIKDINKITKTISSKEESKNILGAEISNQNTDVQINSQTETKEIVNNSANNTEKPTFLQKAFASPRNTTNIILYIVFGIIAISLLLYLFIKMKNYHLDLITNGLIVLAIIGAIFIANYYLSHRSMVITQSIDYSNEQK